MKEMKIAYKVWLDKDGKAFGDGPYELLRRVEKTKSLHQAANQMRMSYSKAWRLIRTLEERLGFVLLERKTGGPSGGGSKVTPQGKDLMNHYERFRRDVEKGLEKIYKKHFGSPPHPIPLALGERDGVRGRKEWK
jgi:molybdate transport system regulatory protein